MIARIEMDPDGLARCSHRNLFGSVCPGCFVATPNLVDVYDQVSVMPSWAIAEAEWLHEAIAHRPGTVRISPMTEWGGVTLGDTADDVCRHCLAEAPRWDHAAGCPNGEVANS